MLILLVLVLVSRPSLAQSRSPDDSSTQDNVYTNFFFQFRYPFTASWVPQPSSVAEELQQGGEQGAGTGASSATDHEKSYYLLTLFRTIPGQGPSGRARAVIALVANDNSTHPEIISGKEAVLLLAQKMKTRRYTLLGEPKEIKISGQSFFRQDMRTTNSAGVTTYQSMVFTTVKGYSLGFLLLSPTRSLLDGMVAGLNQFKFY